ncbi:hypothetical protein LOK49_LG06G03226 [Camellia lanceoleosa]|uniref:Uncharacterized protein n=1 Tax=Camellia lanceoleosa TaxID=1840588 RepID=A0ACC0HF98_9ERIC|nr:hypothetical protein LOK49_LG06G03226 [Camellia lanceoleosa]
METNQRTLTIPFISAKDLERVKLSNKMEVYAYVFISGGGKQKTAVDRDGDTNPTWNGPITFNLDMESAAVQILVFELNCCDQNGGDKVIGEVLVKVKDLMGSIEGSLTYHVRTLSGNPKGALNFLYEWEDQKVAGAVLSPPPPAMAAMTSLTACYPPPVMGPRSYGAAAAAAGQYNSPYPPPVMGPRSYGAAAAAVGQYNSPCPPPAMVMGPPPPGYGYGYGLYPLVQVQEQAEPAKKKKGGWFGRVLAAAISDVLNNVSLPDDLGF